MDIDYADSDEDESNSKVEEIKIGRKQTFGDYGHASEWINHLNQHSRPTVDA